MKTILLVKDNSADLIALALLLRSHGYGVVESSDGEEAINACLEHQGPIDLLLMDCELGGSNRVFNFREGNNVDVGIDGQIGT